MTPKLLEELRNALTKLGVSFGKVLEVGSLDINGSVREIIKNYESYIGIDLTIPFLE